jgi:hypothetical protein
MRGAWLFEERSMTRFFNPSSLCSMIIYSATMAAGRSDGEMFEEHVEHQFDRVVQGLAEYEIDQVRAHLRFLMPVVATCTRAN